MVSVFLIYAEHSHTTLRKKTHPVMDAFTIRLQESLVFTSSPFGGFILHYEAIRFKNVHRLVGTFH